MKAIQKETKGVKTKEALIELTCEVFNKKGIDITLKELSDELNVGISQFINHFGSKDRLFIAIALKYNESYTEMMKSFFSKNPFNLYNVVVVLSKIMELQYKYRSSLIAVISRCNSEKIIHNHITEMYSHSSASVKEFINNLVDLGILERTILEEDNFLIFNFQFVNLCTTWIVSKEMYDAEVDIVKAKQIYLQGIMHCFIPHFTKNGKKQFSTIDIKSIVRN
jgi:AcrR family transcriptional regulator